MNAKTQRFWIGTGLFAVLLGIALCPLLEGLGRPADVAIDAGEAAGKGAALRSVGGPKLSDPVVETGRPGRAAIDLFHPDRETVVTPRRGGRVTLRLASMPGGLNRMLDNTGAGGWILNETHEWLLARDWETWEFKSVLTERFDIDDTLRLVDGTRLCGSVRLDGSDYVLESIDSGEHKRIPVADVDEWLQGTVFTFQLRDDVTWQDGHPFTVDDVRFTFECYRNPHVNCDRSRYKFERIREFEVLDEQTVRFHYEEQYMSATEVFADFCLIPSHVFDLRDPDHPQHDPDATDEAVGEHLNKQPANRMWIGLGPYRITRWDAQLIEAERWDGYHASEQRGWLDTIRWRHISDDSAAAQALLNGELDYHARMKTDDYFGSYTQRDAFTDEFYKGYFYTGYMNYVAWNFERSKFQDVRVRTALAHAFDWDELLEGVYHGLGMRVTSTIFRYGPNYDESVTPLPFDLERAEELLTKAGWVDRDGDGLIDRDGEAFSFEYLYGAGNSISLKIGQLYQQKLGRLGIRVRLKGLEWGAFLERVYARDFDAMDLGWSLPVLSDPFNMWHSSMAEGYRTNNRGGLRDERSDELIEGIQVELDPGRRAELFHALHQRLYELQPYNFGTNVPRKFGMSKQIRGFQIFGLSPGYSVRRWFRDS